MEVGLTAAALSLLGLSAAPPPGEYMADPVGRRKGGLPVTISRVIMELPQDRSPATVRIRFWRRVLR